MWGDLKSATQHEKNNVSLSRKGPESILGCYYTNFKAKRNKIITIIVCNIERILKYRKQQAAVLSEMETSYMSLF